MVGVDTTKEVKKTEVKGSAQFENGQLKVPIMENGTMSMKTARELKSILDKKEKVNKSDKQNNKQKLKVGRRNK